MKQFVERINNKICIDSQYFNNVFIKPSKQGNISGLTLRLMALLITELSFYQWKKIPSRRKISKMLSANESSIHKCLVSLEENKFFYRSINPVLENIVRDDEEKQKEYSTFYAERIEENKSKQRFNDFFKLNSNYQNEDESYEEFIKSLKKGIFHQCDDVSIDQYLTKESIYNNEIIEAIIQRFLIELLKDKNILESLIQKSITDK